MSLKDKIEQVIRDVPPRHYGPLMVRVDAYLNARTRENFAKRETPEGQAWPGDATLVKTGALLAEATSAGRLAAQGWEKHGPVTQILKTSLPPHKNSLPP